MKEVKKTQDVENSTENVEKFKCSPHTPFFVPNNNIKSKIEEEEEDKNKTTKKDNITVLEDDLLAKLGLTITFKGQTSLLIKKFGLKKMLAAVERIRIYYQEAKRRKWKHYVLGYHWGNLMGRINDFMTDESFRERVEMTQRGNDRKNYMEKHKQSQYIIGCGYPRSDEDNVQYERDCIMSEMHRLEMTLQNLEERKESWTEVDKKTHTNILRDLKEEKNKLEQMEKDIENAIKVQE